MSVAVLCLAAVAAGGCQQGLLPKELPAPQRQTAEAKRQYNRGLELQESGKLAEAMPLFYEAVRLDPDLVLALNHLAWLKATHTDEKIRNAAQAVELSERACRIATDPDRPMGRAYDYLDTLAAAYAEAGRFEDAVRTAKKAVEMSRDRWSGRSRYDYRQRLKLYEEKRPYRETPQPRRRYRRRRSRDWPPPWE